MVLLPGSFKQGHFAFKRAGYILVYPHGGAVVLFAQVLDSHIQVGQYLIGNHGTAVSGALHLFLYRVQHLIDPGKLAVVYKHLVIIPGPEVIGLADALVHSRTGLLAISEVVDQEIDIADVGVVGELCSIAQRRFAGKPVVYHVGDHIVAGHVAKGDTRSITHVLRLGTHACLVKLVQVFGNLGSAAECSRCGENTLRKFIEVRTACQTEDKC